MKNTTFTANLNPKEDSPPNARGLPREDKARAVQNRTPTRDRPGRARMKRKEREIKGAAAAADGLP